MSKLDIIRTEIKPLPPGVKLPEFCGIFNEKPENFERLCKQIFEYLIKTNTPCYRVTWMAEQLIEYYVTNSGACASVTIVSAWPDLVFVATVTADNVDTQQCKITVGVEE